MTCGHKHAELALYEPVAFNKYVSRYRSLLQSQHNQRLVWPDPAPSGKLPPVLVAGGTPKKKTGGYLGSILLPVTVDDDDS